MSTIDILSPAGDKAGTVELPAEIFDAQVSIPLIHQVVVAQLAAARQGTHKTKTRAEVSGAGRKPFKQKGTGRARQGSIRAPHMTGGGVVHGPQPRDYSQRTPKKMKAAALRGALTDRAREDRVHVVSTFVDGDKPATKAALATLDAVSTGKRVLVVLDYDVLVNDEIVFTEAALAEFVAGRTRGGEGTVKPDLATHETPGGIPSIAPAEGEGTVETEATPAKKATAKTAPAKKAADAEVETEAAAEVPAKKATAKKAPAEQAAPDSAAEAAKAPVEQAEAANAGPDAVAPTDEGTTDASTEEKA
jgi:large subunit ribosomal protein L4